MGKKNKLKLHEAIVQLLKGEEKNEYLTYQEIADGLNDKNLYTRRDKKPIPSNQIAARVRKKRYRHLFKMKIGLPEWN
ncbi:MAG: hypothetical protein LBT49_05350 [Prevotellaceae bacterium]|jgi:hypothetical protein|nr:hypothetical protein [Prevotellaceae bacterium]